MTGRKGRTGRGMAAGIAVAGIVGLGLLALPGGAGAQPALPPVSPEDLVASVLKAKPGAFNGTVQMDNQLGLPALPNAPQAATDVLAALQPTSTISVDGTDEVAGRPAYDLVLAPKPTERTLLREVRIAVDAQERMPLRLTVLGQGSTSPALQVGFTDLTFGQQDPARFTFTPPAGAKVTDAPARGAQQQRDKP